MKKNIKIIILISLLIAVTVILLFVFQQRGDVDNDQPSEDLETSPFGESDPRPNSDFVNDQETRDLSDEFLLEDQILSDRIRPLVSESVATRIIGDVEQMGDSGYRVLNVQPSTGHIYQAFTQSLYTELISNTTLPHVQEAVFSPTGSHVLYRYMDVNDQIMRSYLGELLENEMVDQATSSATSSNSTLDKSLFRIEGKFLPSNSLDVVFSPGGDEFLYLLDHGTSLEGVIENLGTGEERSVFQIPLTEVRPIWNEDGSIYLITKPSAKAKGYLFRVQNGQLRKITEGNSGFTVNVSPAGNQILLSEVTNNQHLELFVFDLTTQTKSKLSIATLPDKCVWESDAIVYCAVPKELPRSTYPDDWYQGAARFEDVIVRIDIASDATSSIVDPKDYGYGPLDLVDPEIDEQNQVLIFRDRRSESSWMVSL